MASTLAQIRTWLQTHLTNSIAVHLMLEGINIDQSVCGGSASYAPMAYMADRFGFLPRIEEPIARYDIDKRGVPKWKNNLKENWLLEHDAVKRLEKFNRPQAAIVELLAANLLSKDHSSVASLEAWGGKSDIEFDDGYRFEIKFFGDAPYCDKNLLYNMRNRKPQAITVPVRTSVNYTYFRLAEGIWQHKNNSIPIAMRGLMLLFADAAMIPMMQHELMGLKAWMQPGIDSLWDSLIAKHKKKSAKILALPPHQYLQEATDIRLGILKDWEIIRTQDFYGNPK